MKSIAVVLFALSTLSAFAAPRTFDYSCGCVDTGVECDGMEKMKVTVTDDVATIEIGDEDWDFVEKFETERNDEYSPREGNKSFNQFKITSAGKKSGYQIDKSNFLLAKALVRGSKSGEVKFQSVQEENTGGGFYSWLFRCAKD